MNHDDRGDRAILQDIAHRAMLDRGLLPEFSPRALVQLEALQAPATDEGRVARDLRSLPWCSIDNDDSLDLDQLTVAERLTGDSVRVHVGVAD